MKNISKNISSKLATIVLKHNNEEAIFIDEGKMYGKLEIKVETPIRPKLVKCYKKIASTVNKTNLDMLWEVDKECFRK